MRKLITLSCVMLMAYGQSALPADATDKPVVVAAASVKNAEGNVARATVAPTSIPVGVLESFGAIGFAP